MIRSLVFLTLSFFQTWAFSESSSYQDFSQLPKYQNIVLSPDGKKVALIQNSGDLAVITVLDLVTKQPRYLVKTDNVGVRVRWLNWANSDRLIFGLMHASRRNGNETYDSRLYSIAVDGSEAEPVSMYKKNRGKVKEELDSQYQDRVIDLIPSDPDHVLLSMDAKYFAQPSVYKLNVKTGRRLTLEGGKEKVRRWLTDQQNRVRVGVATDYETGLQRVLVKHKPGDPLKELFRYNMFEEPSISPLGFDLNPDILFYQASHEGRQALFKINLSDNETELVASHEVYDVDGSLIYSSNTGAAVGVYHRGVTGGIYFWDDDRAKLQSRIDAALPGTSNRIISTSLDESVMVVRVEGDSLPPTYYLLNPETFQFAPLLRSYPQLVGINEVPHKFVTYTARDGLEIEGYLTLPPNVDEPIATILHPHGGPASRDSKGFDYWTSYFVNQGYAVFRPNFRGSSGQGFEFARAQYERWGLEMQDDLEDAVAWLVSEKISDPERICIVGASYGGYAAMLAAARSPGLFRCAVSFAGVADLKLFVEEHRSTLQFDLIKKQIGKRSGDLKSRSPVHMAREFEVPVLIVHGESDRVVSADHSIKLAKQLKRRKKDHKLVLLPAGDHYLSVQRNRHTMFKEMDTFLAKHLVE